jgi:predicted dehydrogenase
MDQAVFVIGCGSIGERHIRNLRSLGVTTIGAFDPAPERLAQVASTYGAIPYPDVETGLAAAPDAVLVCTPPHLHLPLACRAVDAGAHVFIEKPIAHRLDGVDGLLHLAAARGRVVCVGYNLRFHAGLRTAKALIDAGAIGPLLALRAEFGQYLPDWRPQTDYRAGYNVRAATGGGIILDASHELDYVRWLGGEVERVFCVAGRLSDLDMDAEDTAAIILRLHAGRLAEVHLDCVQRGYARGCKAIGQQGTLVWDLNDGVHLLPAGSATWQRFPATADRNQMYLDELRHFLACVRGKEQPLVDGWTGRRVLEIALAARQSAAEGREVAIPAPAAGEALAVPEMVRAGPVAERWLDQAGAPAGAKGEEALP